MAETNVTPADQSEKGFVPTLLLCFFLGALGVHRFYVGKIGTGILMLLTGGGLGIWWLIDFIKVASGTFTDLDGRRIVRWEPGGAESIGPLSSRKMELVLEELDLLRGDMAELNERVDFVERLLTRLREQGAISPGPSSP